MSTPEPDQYRPIPDIYDVADGLARLLDAWMPEYLAAIERHALDLEVDTLARPARVIVRHAGLLRRAEQTPAIVVFPAGLTDIVPDPDGQVTGTAQLGVFVVVDTPSEDSTTRLVHRHASAVKACLLHRHPATVCQGLTLIDEDDTAVDVADQGRVRAGVTLSYEAHGVDLGHRRGGPPPGADPREDPLPPWPPVPTVATTHLTVDTVGPSDPLEPR
ncbi:MAG: hypothetical protein AB7G37_00925 [Solirubrobacteraceae bacterium]